MTRQKKNKRRRERMVAIGRDDVHDEVGMPLAAPNAVVAVVGWWSCDSDTDDEP